MGELCDYCDGTGERDFLSGARCLYCDGTGWREDEEDDFEFEDEPDWLTEECSQGDWHERPIEKGDSNQ